MISVKTRAILVISASFLYQCMLGAFYIWGTISVYVASFYRQFDKDITSRELGTFMPIRAVMLMFLLPIGSMLEKTYGPRKIIGIGAICMTVSVFILGFIKSPFWFVAIFSFGFGVPTIAFYVPMMCAWRYFPEKRGLITGLSVCGFSLGSLIFSYLSRILVNPNDEAPKEFQSGAIKDHYFEENVYKNVPRLFITLSIIWGLILAYVVFVTQDPPKEYMAELAEKQKKDEEELLKKRQIEGNATEQNIECPDVKTALKHITFWILLAMLTISTWSDFVFGLAYKELGFNYHYPDAYLTEVGLLYSMANCSGRLFWGIMSQKYRFTFLYIAVLAGQAFFSLTLITIAWSKVLYPIWIMMSTFFTCGNFVLFPPLSVQVYGAKIGGNVYSFIATGFAFGAFALYFVNVYVLPSIGYKSMLQTLGIFSAACYILLYFIELKPQWDLIAKQNNSTELKQIEGSQNKDEKLLDSKKP